MKLILCRTNIVDCIFSIMMHKRLWKILTL